MCKFKSAIILKDKVFMPNYNSHTTMLEELKIEDNLINAKTKFIRAEIYPENGDKFTDINSWKYHVDQDVLPDWYVSEFDEKRMRDELAMWITTRNGIYTNKKELKQFNVGDTFLIGNIEYVVLDKDENTVSCLSVDFINDNKRFDRSANVFDKSEIKQYLNTTYLDWLKQHAEVVGGVGLLTLDQYRRYKDIIPNAESWWWLSTPFERSSYFVYFVRSGGRVDYYDCYYNYCGVRPFCILKSNILVSCK